MSTRRTKLTPREYRLQRSEATRAAVLAHLRHAGPSSFVEIVAALDGFSRELVKSAVQVLSHRREIASVGVYRTRIYALDRDAAEDARAAKLKEAGRPWTLAAKEWKANRRIHIVEGIVRALLRASDPQIQAAFRALTSAQSERYADTDDEGEDE